MSLCKAEMQRESDNEARILFFMYGVVLVGVSACACMRVYVSCVCMRMRVRAYAPGGTLKADSLVVKSCIEAFYKHQGSDYQLIEDIQMLDCIDSTTPLTISLAVECFDR
eukprot:1160905-Pelagomonas_calceolata.AAC.12